MIWLLLVSILWGFSFGLIKTYFAGFPSDALAALRLLLALPLFLPFLNLKKLRSWPIAANLLITGAVQYGLMYLCLFASFQYLKAYEVALMTVFTPLYILGLRCWHLKKAPSWQFWASTVLAIGGAALLFSRNQFPGQWQGVLLMQISNFAFAFGQLQWRSFKVSNPKIRSHEVYGLLYLGGVILTLPITLTRTPWQTMASLESTQWAVLLYLGVMASGLGFFLWNIGATRVRPPALAVMNNLKIPIATAISILLFKENAHWPTFFPAIALLLIGLEISRKSNH